MKLSEYAAKLNALLAEHPESSEYKVVTSIDDEGNGFNPVVYDPALGVYDSDEREFAPKTVGANSVCLN